MKEYSVAEYILIFICIIGLTAFPLMWLWNWLMPYLFALPTITFGKALGLNLLSTMLFKSSQINPNNK